MATGGFLAAFSQYKNVLWTMTKNSIATTFKYRNNKRSNQIAGKIAMAFVILMIMAYGAVMSMNMTLAAYDNGMMQEYLHFVLFIGQAVVLFLGGYTAMGNLYFSRDNALLATLPISPAVLFAAKFTITYVAELFYSFILLFPMLTATGVMGIVWELGITPAFFGVEVIAILTAPVLPLIIVTALSMPLMRLMAALKRRSIGTGVIMTILYIGVIIGYYALIGTMVNFSSDEETGKILMPASTVSTFEIIKKITIYNYPLAEGMLGHNSLLYSLAYVGSALVLLCMVILLSKFLYGKCVKFTLERGETASAKSKRKSDKRVYGEASPLKAMYIKEFRTLVKSPMLLVSTLMSVFLPAVVMFFFKFTMSSSGDGEFTNIFLSGIVTMMAFTVIGGANQTALIGFSREGKSFMLTLSLPISREVIIKAKLLFATTVTACGTLFTTILYPFILEDATICGTIGFFLFILVGGFGMNTINLLTDLKAPNFKWQNVNELTKNNKKSFKPMLISLGIGMFAMILQVVISLQSLVTGEALAALYFGICLVPAIIIAVVGYKKLIKNYAKYIEDLEV